MTQTLTMDDRLLSMEAADREDAARLEAIAAELDAAKRDPGTNPARLIREREQIRDRMEERAEALALSREAKRLADAQQARDDFAPRVRDFHERARAAGAPVLTVLDQLAAVLADLTAVEAEYGRLKRARFQLDKEVGRVPPIAPLPSLTGIPTGVAAALRRSIEVVGRTPKVPE